MGKHLYAHSIHSNNKETKMRAIKTIKNPEAFKLLADETRRKIVFLLRAKEMTVSQIAADLNVTPQTVYHHIKKLLKGEMVEVAREVRVDHLIESYYRSTAETFFCHVGKSALSGKIATEQMTTILGALKGLGFNIEYDKEKISELVDIQTKLEESWKKSSEIEEKISDLEDVDFLTKQTVQKFAETLLTPDEEYAKQQQLSEKMRSLLRSLAKS
jgi:DNA-binding transcriptional ArsR family regulator